MSCRYNPGGMFKITNDIMDNPGDAKYGMTTEQLFEAFRIMKSKGVEEFGLHAFLCSNTVTNEYYPLLAKVLFDVAVRAEERAGRKNQLYQSVRRRWHSLPSGAGAERYFEDRRRCT